MQHVLEKIKVVELGGYIVGSFCATLLADMGADVVKVETFSGDGLRGQLGAFQGYNRGKRGIVVDPRRPEGKMVLRKLAENADVLVQNLRHGVAEQMTVDYPTVKAYNPRIVYLAMPGYGQTGPYVNKPAFDPLLQAMSGAMAAQGGKGKAPVYLRAAISDFSGAMLGAFGIATALYTRAKTGEGQLVNSSLLNAAIAIQAAEFLDYEDKQSSFRMGSLGRNAINRLYKTKNNWIFIGCVFERHWPALCAAIGREDLLKNSCFKSFSSRRKYALTLSEILGDLFKTQSAGYWIKRLESKGVPCSRVNRFREMTNHPQLLANDLVAEHPNIELGIVKQRGMVVNLSDTPGKLQRGAPELGEHTNEVLTELGYTFEEIESLRNAQVIK
ncbi:MAG: CoA transferase [Dehalococcoidales bacterium]|nr:CoA transferase [Dehalococcoidales bacterium]